MPKSTPVLHAEGLKPKDVAAITSIDVRKVHKLMRDPNGIKSFQLGSRLRTTRAEVDKFLKGCVAGDVAVPDLIAPILTYSSASKIEPKRLKKIQQSKKFEYIPPIGDFS